VTGGLHVDVHEGDGPYCLLVHGILSSRAQWVLNLDALKAVCRPVVVELLGHGRSQSPEASEPYTPDGYVAAFERVRESLDADRWFVIGQSLGAALTLRYALDEPDRFIAHVFTNSSSALADEKWQKRMKEIAPTMAKRIEEGGMDALTAMPIHPRHAKRMTDEVKRALVEDAELLRPDGVVRGMLHTVPTSSVRGSVQRNRVPTLLVAGSKEREFHEATGFARANIPQLEIVELEAGHAVNIHASGVFNTAVTRFFGSL
jgi:pimeloyl-ACP methyl ester carboxylesterase